MKPGKAQSGRKQKILFFERTSLKDISAKKTLHLLDRYDHCHHWNLAYLKK